VVLDAPPAKKKKNLSSDGDLQFHISFGKMKNVSADSVASTF
jgi:hypothetical protein